MKGVDNMAQVELSNRQAREIARNIYADIDAYVENHRDEYEVFLKEEGLFEREGVKV